jgi:hypothetical protein
LLPEEAYSGVELFQPTLRFMFTNKLYQVIGSDIARPLTLPPLL